jgi:ectoine hydroxylase-related dioxygenase (phytanoyl-CoA dioxygenase family)
VLFAARIAELPDAATTLSELGWPAPHATEPPSASVGQGDNLVDADLKRHWRDQGFVHLSGVFGQEEIAEYNAIVARVRREVEEDKDEYGYGDRIGQLHQKETDLLKLAANERITRFLTWAFGEDPVLFASLQFERGTQQEAHIDAIFFWPEPAYAMAGAWIALEDIDPDAGPLFYVPGSHKLPFFNSDDVVARDSELKARREAARAGVLPPEQRQALVQQVGLSWTERLLELHEHHGLERVTLPVRAGDVIIWHSLLAHGGSPRLNPSLSRRSAVFHYFGKSAGLYSVDQFMFFDRAELPSQPPVTTPRRVAFGLEYMLFDHFVTYARGAEILHPVSR